MLDTLKTYFYSWRFVRHAAIAAVAFAAILLISIWMWVITLSRGLPSEMALAEYEPPITSRVHAGDGTLIYEFADQHRVFIPYDAIPEHVVQAFISAEDKNFFSHNGLDYAGILRGARNSLISKLFGSGALQGGSTITQQVAKNMLLSNAQAVERKIKEAVVARRMEQTFSKEHILELYLNEIYLGGRSYGVGSAALNYFNKSLPELNISEAAVLASLPKFPGRVNPYTNPERLLYRRDYVIGRMLSDGYITAEEAEEAKAMPLETTRRFVGEEYSAALYFVQELRKQLIDQYGEEMLAQEGLSIRTTIDTRLQLAAQTSLRDGLEAYDRRHGYRGPIANIDAEAGDVLEQLNATRLPPGYGDWEGAMVQRVSTSGARLLLTDGNPVDLSAEDVEWAASYQRARGQTGLRRGDVILVDVTRPAAPEQADGASAVAASASGILAEIRQIPEVEGGLVALDPHTGRVLAMVGGYSFFKSPFNRITQARRQPGSAFKPFVYGAALERGYTPGTRILDAPYVYYDPNTGEVWKPQNYIEGRSYGQETMRVALEQSHNQVTARVATDIGLEAVSEFGERFGIYDNLPPYPAMALGSGETTPWRMAKAYAAFVNGGREVRPTLLDRVQDRHGATLYRHDERDCVACDTPAWDGGLPPRLADDRTQLLDPIIAYQLVHMLTGVVERGTARGARRIGKPVAAKTGTTNDYVDALTFGFSPDLVVGVWVGFDTPKTLGEDESGGAVAGVIFTDFMESALADKPGLPFRIPPGVRLVNIDAETGELPTLATRSVITEAFRPGSEPGLRFSSNIGLSLSGSSNGSDFDQDFETLDAAIIIDESVDQAVEESFDDIY